MCDNCTADFSIDVDVEIEKLKENLDDLKQMRQHQRKMNLNDQTSADSLYESYISRGSLTDKQWNFVRSLTARITEAEPIYGSFDPILVMFRLTQANEKRALRKPKIRLMSDQGVYVELRFNPGTDAEKMITVYRDGWQGHGVRKFCGWVVKDRLIPYNKQTMTDDIKNVIQSLAMDPMGVSKAMAAKLGVCIYCGKRLSDAISKVMGYGAQCASNYGLIYPV